MSTHYQIHYILQVQDNKVQLSVYDKNIFSFQKKSHFKSLKLIIYYYLMIAFDTNQELTVNG